MQTRNRVARKMVAAWKEKQYALIAEHRGPVVANACLLEAQDIANRRAWFNDPKPVIFSTKEIDICEARAVSTARVASYGAYALFTPDGGNRWKREYEIARQSVLKGERGAIAKMIESREKSIKDEIKEIINRPPTPSQKAVMEYKASQEKTE
jgi:hypothetical protein